MARSRSALTGHSRRKNGARQALQTRGWTACALGLGVLAVMPQFAEQTPMGNAMVQGLQPVGWITLGIGVLLLALHYAVRQKAPQGHTGHAANQPQPAPPQTTQRGQPQAAQRTAAPQEARAPAAEHALAPNASATPQPSGTPPTPVANTWSLEVFAAIEWRRFEAVCEALFAQAGFETHAQSHGADGGVDIWLHSRNSPGPAAVVQCKHWQSKPVGVRELREFFGVMASHKLKRGTYATTSTYAAEALAFARANSIHTLDGPGLLKLIGHRTPAQQQELLQVAFEGEYWRPTCASCGTKMVERARSSDGGLFWGCSNYPRCKRTLPKAVD